MADDIELLEEINSKIDSFQARQEAALKELEQDLAKKGATIGQIQEAFKEFQSKQGHFKVMGAFGDPGEKLTVQVLKEYFRDKSSEIASLANGGRVNYALQIKSPGTMTASANLNGSVEATYSPVPAVRGRRKLHIRDLLNVIPSATGSWKFYRQNNPVGEGSFDTQVTHGNAKAQLDYDVTEVTITADYLAGFVRIAKQMLQDLPFMQNFVSSELVEDYLRAEDSKFFQALCGAATGDPNASTSTVTAEKIIDYLASLAESDYEANACLVTNLTWSKLLRTKPNDYSIPGGITISPMGDVMICGIPVLRTVANNLGAGRILIGDFSKAAIIQAEGLSVNMYEQDSDNVQRNLITVKAEARVALATLRPDAFIWAGAGTT